jgi:hypothetical protein
VSEQGGIFVTVLHALEQLHIPYMITGSVASVRYGEPRATLDMDVIVDMSPAQASQLARSFSVDYYADEQSMLEAIQRRGSFNIIHGASGIKVDIFLVPNTPYARQAFQRRRRDNLTATFAAYFTSAEDNILGKLLYFREGGSQKHVRDISGILRTIGQTLDMQYLDRCAADLHIADLWDALKSQKDH